MIMSNNNEKLAIRTVRRATANPRKNPPFVKPETKPTKAYDNVPELIEAFQDKEFEPNYLEVWDKEAVILVCYAAKNPKGETK